MAKVKIQGHASGTGVLTVTAPNTSTDRTITLPDSTGTLATTADVPSSITDNGDATAITIDSSEKVSLGGSGSVSSDSQVAIKGGNLELTTTGAKYWIPRASDGALTGSLYSPSGSAVRLSGSGTGSGTIEFEPSSSSGVAMNIDNSGTVGIGKVPETWDANWKALEVGQRTTVASYTGGGGATLFSHNAYSGFTSKYQETAGATGIYMDDENIKFRVASSGTADANITWTNAMQITSSGNVDVGSFSTSGASRGSNNNGEGRIYTSTDTTSAYDTVGFYNPNGRVGEIQMSGSSTSYNTSSDYRLKENVVDMENATDRVKQLKPKRFNFIADDSVTVDGFIAHEVSDIVPEAISGEKDAMIDEEYEVTPAVKDEDGNIVTEAVMGTRSVPDYQGIDQSKLVPLLTSALQEAVAKIEELTTRIETLENA